MGDTSLKTGRQVLGKVRSAGRQRGENVYDRIAQRGIDDGGPNGVVLNTPPCTKASGERCVGMRRQAMDIGLALRRMLAVLVCDMPQSMNVLFEKERSQVVVDVRHGAGVAVGRGATLPSHVSSVDH